MREADVQMIGIHLRRMARTTAKDYPTAVRRFDDLWQIYTEAPGQEHWLCECGQRAARPTLENIP